MAAITTTRRSWTASTGVGHDRSDACGASGAGRGPRGGGVGAGRCRRSASAWSSPGGPGDRGRAGRGVDGPAPGREVDTAMNYMDRTLPERFWDKVQVQSSSGCWLWTAQTDHEGYGLFKWQGIKRVAHRVAFEVACFEPPRGMQLDHLCHTNEIACQGGPTCPHRRCVNPAHLELVTPLENTRRSTRSRKTHCVNGHEFTPENTHIWNGHRQCRACNRAAAKRIRQRRKTGGNR